MRKYFVILMALLCVSIMGKDTNLDSGMKPSHYSKRDKAVFNIALAYYGRFWKIDDLKRIAPLLKERFELATKGKIKLNIIEQEVLDYKTEYDPELMATTYPNLSDPERLQRIFYYETINAKVMQESYEQFKKSRIGQRYSELDALLVVTGAQFQGLGFANGRVAVTEQPREIAWALPEGGRVEIVSDEAIVDELIHELGHTMFLGHTSTHCQKVTDLNERKACCEASPSKNDVMSYCRARGSVGQDQMFGFEECNLSMIDELIVPAMLKGKRWNVPGRKRCR